MNIRYRRPTISDACFLVIIGTFVGILLHSYFGPWGIDPGLGAVLGAIIGVSGAVGGTVWIAERGHRRDKEQAALLHHGPYASAAGGLQRLLILIDDADNWSPQGFTTLRATVAELVKEIQGLSEPNPIVGWQAMLCIRLAKFALKSFDKFVLQPDPLLEQMNRAEIFKIWEALDQAADKLLNNIPRSSVGK